MGIQPLKDNVLISPIKESEKTKTEAGIYLPESAEGMNERPQIGKVVEVGESNKIQVKKGQKVIYNKYSGTEIKLDGKDFLIVKSDDILAVIKK
ncbi:MAG: co-chaperone GroES [Candidatus Moranbacteria bacterium]|jgi:chaperonin GroES|nr:co-chaperone GroES [Candidatus Moranbacteria bacterium]MDD5652102.1 co-chaperone GroES [Candidatus Moranbacteria bacterium]MDX9855765.1 co-chaperone GroES [Candidatus Moranbacteria bacterium]